jgi:hypothetical protein
MVPDDFPYLKGAGASNQLQAVQTQKVSEAFEATIEVRPTAWTMLPYALCATNASAYVLSVDLYHS